MFFRGSACRDDELRVLPEHFKREGDFVDDALAGAVSVGEQFQVLDTIVVPVPVNVVDSFVGEQTSAYVLLHDVAMFEDFLAPQCGGVADHYGHVPPFVATCQIAFSKSFIERRGLEECFTLPVTKFLFSVKRAAGSAAHRVHNAALQAFEVVSNICISSPTQVGAWHGAIQRVSVPLFSKCGYNARLHFKQNTALLAGKREHGDPGSEPSVESLVGGLARSFAKTARAVFWFNGKGFVAVFARQLNWHGLTPLLDGADLTIPGMSCQGVK